ncbi:Nucleoporin nup49/NSP49 (Nuclear pore protein nup49/NSP49) [Rhodotorula kratochvilovae]
MSLFGSTATSAPTFSFGAPAPSSSAAPSAATPAPSLFGAPAPAGSAGGTSLFGAPKPVTPAPSTSLFGAPATSTGGGLFGAAASAPAPAASKPAFSFGAPAQGGGLFGSTTAAPAAGGSLFGAQPAQQGGGLFGAQQQPAQGQAQTQLGGGLFGSATPSATPALGASTATPAQGAISKATKFNDLPDGARSVVEELDKFIRSQCTLAEELKAKDLGSEIVQTQRMYEQYSAEAATVSSLLQTDSRLLSALRAELEQSLSDLSKTTLLIEGFKAPPGSPKAAEAKAVAGFPFEFFRRKADEMKDRAGRYKATMDQLSSLLSAPSHALSPSAIAPTLKAQHASLVSLASAVSALDLELKALKDEYRAIYREKTGRLADPFRVNGAGGGSGVGGVERGLAGVALR